VDADEIARIVLEHGPSGGVNRREGWIECECSARLTIPSGLDREGFAVVWEEEAKARAAHLAAVLSPLVEQAIVAAEQVGREDNAEHDQCYVYGSRALEAKLEQARQEGAREALRAAAGSEFFDGSRRCLVEMADRTERSASPGSGTAGGGS
jgi:hypothetical protein